jgi:glycosyltransferase involved in cell wall biosynthesis
VTTPQSDTPKHVTLILPYYENPRFLKQQLGWWFMYPYHLMKHFSVIVVDDGSPNHPAADVLKDEAIPDGSRLFRIDQDVRWNWLAARNIGAKHAEGWCVFTDMDHVIPQSTLDSLVYGQHDTRTIYGFSRIESTGDKLTAHPNSWFMTRSMFWNVGGYDETLSGHYGTDGSWRRRLAKTAPMAILSDRLVRHEYVGDSSTTTYKRKQPQDAAVKRLDRSGQRGYVPKVLTFPYHEVALGVPV